MYCTVTCIFKSIFIKFKMHQSFGINFRPHVSGSFGLAHRSFDVAGCVPAIMHRECRRCKNTSEKNAANGQKSVYVHMDSSWTAYGWCYFRPYIAYIMAQNIGICITWRWFSPIPHPFILFCLPTNREPWFGGFVCMFARVFHSPQKTPSSSSQCCIVTAVE